MRVLGNVLLALGALVGVVVGLAMLTHVGISSPWLVNVALAKLGLVASAGLMAGGAVTLKLAKRQEPASLPPASDERN